MSVRSAKRNRKRCRGIKQSPLAHRLQLRTAPAMLNQKGGPMKDKRPALRAAAERRDEE